ncbi:MAG TPA: AAA family ATPase, partial [Candidatus Babeliales bacterium]|nr:AAA family ATPase [Candidatus Babeliales bacterium]
MFQRQLTVVLQQRAAKIPVIAILGPRQSGKTTLAKLTFPQYTYVSLENHDQRELALHDPRGFLAKCDNGLGMILDEIQHAPQLLSYIQTLVDEQPRPGYIVLTGSQNILVNQAITQSLAGRITILTLLPLSIAEFKANNLLPKLLEIPTVKGGYPRIYADDLDYHTWYLDYVEAYVERDVRQVGE